MVFCFCVVFDPRQLDGLALTDAAIEDDLKEHVPFLHNHPAVIADLVAELPDYRARVVATSVDGDTDVEGWWEAAKLALPCLFASAVKVMLHSVSSASVERLFSLLKLLFGDQSMASALQDYQRTAVMVRFNANQRDKFVG